MMNDDCCEGDLWSWSLDDATSDTLFQAQAVAAFIPIAWSTNFILVSRSSGWQDVNTTSVLSSLDVNMTGMLPLQMCLYDKSDPSPNMAWRYCYIGSTGGLHYGC
jgi:hypothetical protein